MANVLKASSLLAAAVLCSCGEITPADTPTAITATIEQVFDGPVLSNSLGSVLVRHTRTDTYPGQLSIVHVRDGARILRDVGGAQGTLGFDALAAGVTGRFLTTGYEKRTNPRQVIATQVVITGTE